MLINEFIKPILQKNTEILIKRSKKLEFLNECCGAGSSDGNQNMKNDNA